jgi:hypothetical protein
MAIMKNLIASTATYVNQPKYILPDFYSNFNKIGHAITRFATVCIEDPAIFSYYYSPEFLILFCNTLL